MTVSRKIFHCASIQSKHSTNPSQMLDIGLDIAHIGKKINYNQSEFHHHIKVSVIVG